MLASVVHTIVTAWLGIGSARLADMSVADASRVGRTAFVVTLLTGLFILISRGAGFARFVTTTFLATRITRSVVLFGVKVIFGAQLLSVVLYVLGLVIQVAIICLLWQRSSDQWFAAYDRYRAPTYGRHPTEPGFAPPVRAWGEPPSYGGHPTEPGFAPPVRAWGEPPLAAATRARGIKMRQ